MSSRRQYPFHLIEPKWQAHWDREQTFRAWNPGEQIPANHPFAKRHSKLPPKYYVLDMFPYPSGAGLHVGHPEGYTATDMLARYRRALGFNVLHPMGWDAFGLPAEQYAIKTGQHPRKTTEENIATFKRQIKSLGFSYDWSREVDTTDPTYFKWTQWIFLKMYNSWFNPATNKAEPIETLIQTDAYKAIVEKRAFIDDHRLAYVTEAPVWWCEALGTVLANEEVIEGKSEVGGFPVIRKPMRQWMLRITAYAEKLLSDLEKIDWSHSLKEMQRNWIGRSEGADVYFELCWYPPPQDGSLGSPHVVEVYTTRPDTLFGATYLVIAPEHPVVDKIKRATWPDNTPDTWKRGSVFEDIPASPKEAIERYQAYAATKSDLQRTENKEKTGVFTGIFAINPVNQEQVPVWIADYVLATYGTGAIMAVPGHDFRDHEFACRFDLPIPQVIRGNEVGGKLSNEELRLPVDGKLQRVHVQLSLEGTMINSGFLSGMHSKDARKAITDWLEDQALGKKTINYKLRDWLFSRQRYWGEPFPIVWKNGHHEALPESALPVLPPQLTDYKPTASGEPPLARAKDWVTLPDGSTRETNSMPQWAGSCWYYLRFIDSQNPNAFCAANPEHYWMGTTNGNGTGSATVPVAPVGVSPTESSPGATPGIDLYVGGTEHAVLHLLYSRFWHKVLYDLGHVSTPEPFFKLVNQGMILGEDGQKMAKARGNVVNPDEVVREYGADALRLFEMFMGPLEMVKPWSTKGVEGVYRFLGRVWRLFVDEKSETEFEQRSTTEQGTADLLNIIQLHPGIKDVAPTAEQLKTLHAAIKKVTEDLDGLRFNTAISALMVFVNEAMTWETRPRAVLRDFLILLQPFAPHLAEELFSRLEPQSDLRLPYIPWPKFDPTLLVEDTLEIPVQVNGKLRDKIVVPATATQQEIEAAALKAEKAQPFLAGKTIKKIIVVPKRLVNIAVT